MKKQLRIQVVVFTLTRVVINTMFRMVTPLLPVFRDGLGVKLEDMTRLLTWRSLVGVFGPVVASLADSHGRKIGMLFGLFLFIIGTGVVVIWPTYTGFALALILTALAKYSFDPSMQAYVGDHVSYHQRGSTLALIEIGWSGAFFFGIPIMGFMIARSDWMAPFPTLGILGVAAFFIFLRMLPPDPPVLHKRPTLFNNLGLVLASPAALATLGVVILLSASNEVVNLIFGVWLEGSFQLQVAALGGVAAAIGLAEILGEGLVSGFVDRLGKRRAVGIGLVVSTVFTLLLPYFGGTLAGAVWGLFFFYLAFEFTFVSLIPLASEMIPQARATFMALTFAGASIGRAFAAMGAAPLYEMGFSATTLVAAGLNVLALLALSRVVLPKE